MSKRTEYVLLGAIALLFVGMSCVGITWGLPSRSIDKYLFGDHEPWSGEKIHRLAGAAEKLSADTLSRRGADVDLDPLDKQSDEPILLTGNDEDVAKIYLRYRLYTYQPDEMITMMALAGMDPRRLQLDPRLYQYGGLFIYPVGALIGACGAAGLIDVRSDVVFYLDNPDEFGKFYIVARAYSAAWGLVGVILVFAIGRRLGGSRAGLLAALLFALMPVVVCMAHEGKPHLPGAVLMLMAVYFAMRHLESRAAGGMQSRLVGSLRETTGLDDQSIAASSRGLPTSGDSILSAEATTSDRLRGLKSAARGGGCAYTGLRDWWLTCVCCGAAFGMVLSSWAIFVLIPLVAWLTARAQGTGWTSPPAKVGAAREADGARPAELASWRGMIRNTATGCLIGLAAYLITNPYVLINAVANREVLASNFGNSFAMYDIARIFEGFVRVLELTVEGATLPIVVLGAVALLAVLVRRVRSRTTSGKPSPECKREAPTPVAGALGSDAPRDGGIPQVNWSTAMLPLVVPAAVFFLQFVLIGAGKPAEYGRFGIFPDTALAIGAACLLNCRWTRRRVIGNWIPVAVLLVWTAFFGSVYLDSFHRDATEDNSRLSVASRLASMMQSGEPVIGVSSEPAPYGCPPMDFSKNDVFLVPGFERARMNQTRWALVCPIDTPDEWLDDAGAVVFARGFLRGGPRVFAPISWANKPFVLVASEALRPPPEPD